MPVETAQAEVMEVMTVPQISRILGVSRNVGYDYCRRGLIPHRRLGGRIIISRQAFYAWLNAAPSDQIKER